MFLPESYAMRIALDRTYATPTYRLDLERGRLTGHIDGTEAMAQAIWKRLLTEQGVHPIYKDYGLRTADLIGRDAPYVYAVLSRRIREALLRDDRVTAVDGFRYTREGDTLSLGFTAHTPYGAISLEKEVLL